MNESTDKKKIKFRFNMGLLQRIRTSLRHQGVKVTVLKLCSLIADYLFDTRYGIDTSTWVRLEDLTIDSDNKERGIRYEPARVMPLRKLFIVIKPLIHVDSVLVDLGCGKGRVLLVASEFGFREVRGVEFARELCEIAKHNSAVYKAKTGVRAEFRIIESDVINYTINTDEDVFFMFNPFDEWVLNKVLYNITVSLLIHSRKILIIYHKPENSHVFELWENFVRLHEFSFYGYNYIVYSNYD